MSDIDQMHLEYVNRLIQVLNGMMAALERDRNFRTMGVRPAEMVASIALAGAAKFSCFNLSLDGPITADQVIDAVAGFERRMIDCSDFQGGLGQ